MAVTSPGAPRLLCYRALGLGDLLTAIPTLRSLRRGYPGHRMIVATSPVLHPLVYLAGCADEAMPVKPLEPLNWHGPPPALAVNLHGSGPESHEVLRALQPGRLVAYQCEDAGWSSGPEWREDEHEVERWARLVEESLALHVDRADLCLYTPFERRPGVAVVHPGGSDPARRWPAEKFGEVAWALSTVGLEVVVTGTAEESRLVETVVDEGMLPTGANLAGRLDLVALAGLLSSASVLISGDTGVGHLATAVGTPSVLLFGPASPRQWGPPARPEHRVIHRQGVAARDLDVPAADVAALALEVRRRADVGNVRALLETPVTSRR